MKEVYLHIGNGGVTVTAGQNERGYLQLGVKATHFGNITNALSVMTDAESLRLLAKMLNEIADQGIQEADFCLASAIDRDVEGIEPQEDSANKE